MSPSMIDVRPSGRRQTFGPEADRLRTHEPRSPMLFSAAATDPPALPRVFPVRGCVLSKKRRTDALPCCAAWWLPPQLAYQQ